jgi:hypothetical protein
MADLECPYCEKELEVFHDGDNGYNEGDTNEMECHHCGKTFVFSTSIIFHYSPSKADCLNGANHDWQPSQTFPREFSVMRCTMCNDERKPTTEEMNEIMNK